MGKIIINLKKYRRAFKYIIRSFVAKQELGYCGSNSILENPVNFETPKNVFLYENARIRDNVRIINSPKEKVIVKKFSVVASGVTIITNSHRKTVSIPQFLLGASHVNDISNDIVIEEDVWVGADAILLPGAQLSRGCVIAAGAIVSKPVPPYAVVAGCPAKIIAVVFSIEDILKHEQTLYKDEERMSYYDLKKIFDEHYEGKRVFGTSDGIDEDALEAIRQVKQRFHFIES